jgi:hypothetical protein
MGRKRTLASQLNERPLTGDEQAALSVREGRYADAPLNMNERRLFTIARPKAALPLSTKGGRSRGLA